MSRQRTVSGFVFRRGVATCCALIMACSVRGWAEPPSLDVKIEQVTSGPKHHFFGYIGQCQTIPWNASGRYILGMEIARIDRLPEPEQAAAVFLVDTEHNKVTVLTFAAKALIKGRMTATFESTQPLVGIEPTMRFWCPVSQKMELGRCL